MSEQSEGISAHITESTLLQPAIHAWKFYLRDQGGVPITRSKLFLLT